MVSLPFDIETSRTRAHSWRHRIAGELSFWLAKLAHRYKVWHWWGFWLSSLGNLMTESFLHFYSADALIMSSLNIKLLYPWFVLEERWVVNGALRLPRKLSFSLERLLTCANVLACSAQRVLNIRLELLYRFRISWAQNLVAWCLAKMFPEEVVLDWRSCFGEIVMLTQLIVVYCLLCDQLAFDATLNAWDVSLRFNFVWLGIMDDARAVRFAKTVKVSRWNLIYLIDGRNRSLLLFRRLESATGS